MRNFEVAVRSLLAGALLACAKVPVPPAGPTPMGPADSGPAPMDSGSAGAGEGGGYGCPGICDFAHAADLLVEAQIQSLGSPLTVVQAGLTPTENALFALDANFLVQPMTLSITTVVFGTPPSTTLNVLFQTSAAFPLGPDGGPGAGGYFFVTRYGGQWVVLRSGFFTWDEDGNRRNGCLYRASPSQCSGSGCSSDIPESIFMSQALAERASSASCYTPPHCPVAGTVLTDAGTCMWADGGPLWPPGTGSASDGGV